MSIDWALVAEVIKAALWPAVVLLLGLPLKNPVRGFLENVARSRPTSIKGPGFEVALADLKETSDTEPPTLLDAGAEVVHLPPLHETVDTGAGLVAAASMEGTASLKPDPADATATALASVWPSSNEVRPLDPGVADIYECPPVASDERLELELVAHAPLGAVLIAWRELERSMAAGAKRIAPGRARAESFRDLLATLGLTGAITNRTAKVLLQLEKLRDMATASEEQSLTSKSAAMFIELVSTQIATVKSGVDRVRLRQLLDQLGTDDAMEVVLSRRKSRTTLGGRNLFFWSWLACFESTEVIINDRDADLLRAAGAKVEEPSEQ